MKLKYYKKKPHKESKDYSDVVMTPVDLAWRIVDHFSPSGRVLEPASGGAEGGFISHPAFTDWCEVRLGKDFYDWEEHVDWIITNPPYSLLSQFLEACLTVADNVVLAPIHFTHCVSSKKRMKMIRDLGFSIKEVVLLDTPAKPWPQTGFQYVCIHFQRGYQGDVKWTDWRSY